VAVAAGLAYAALGSDTGGSIRFPSACNGLVGLKPTYGRVSLYGAFPLANSLDHIGPMTRSVEDAARVLQAIAGFDPQDSNSADEPVPAYLPYLQPSNEPVIVGIDETYISAGVPESVTQVLTDALARAGTNVEVRKITIPASY
jgi:amidase